MKPRSAVFLLVLMSATTACGGGGGSGDGTPNDDNTLTGTPIKCEGYWVSPSGEQFGFPQLCDGSGNCSPHPSPAGFSCQLHKSQIGTDNTFFEPQTDYQEGFCACGTPNDVGQVLEEDQVGDCKTVCDRIATDNLVLQGETGWSCGEAHKIAQNGQGQAGTCKPGSIVYMNQGPSDYSTRLVGEQTTGGSKYNISREDSSLVEGYMEFSIGDQTGGCASGCAFQSTNLQFGIHSFELDPVDILGFGWDGLKVNEATLVIQGMLDGEIFDDGRFELEPSGATVALIWSGRDSGKRGSDLDRPIKGSFNFETGEIQLDPITYSQGDGAVTISDLSGLPHEAPPKAIIATPPTIECASPQGTVVNLDASGSSDPQGEALTYGWKLNGVAAGFGEISEDVLLSLGTHVVHLTARDATLGRSHASKEISVEDTTPPAWVAPEKADFTTCDAQLDRHFLQAPVVTDSCTGVEEVRVFLIEENGNSLVPGVELDAESAELPKGEGLLMWMARDVAGNVSTVVQEFEVGAALVAQQFEIRDRVQILQSNGTFGAIGALGPNTTSLGVDSILGEVQAVGSLFLQNRAKVIGLGRSEREITKQMGATIQTEEAFSDVQLVALPWLAGLSASFPGGDVNVSPDSVRTLESAEAGRVQVFSRSRLIIPFTTTRIRELWLEPDSVVQFTAEDPILEVGDRWIHRGSIEGDGALTVFVSGSEVLLERPVRGASIIAPNANITVTTMADGSRVGLLVGNRVEVQPDVSLWCDRQSQL